MSTLLDEDTTTVILEALDFDTPCLLGEHKADLIVECRTCPCSSYWCRAHWAEKVARIELFVRLGIGVLYCGVCHATGKTIEDVVRVVEL